MPLKVKPCLLSLDILSAYISASCGVPSMRKLYGFAMTAKPRKNKVEVKFDCTAGLIVEPTPSTFVTFKALQSDPDLRAFLVK